MAMQPTICKLLFIILSVFLRSIFAQYSCEDFAREPLRNFTISDTFEGILESIYISDIEDAEIQSSAHLEASVNTERVLTISVKANFDDHDGDNVATAKLVIDCANYDYTIDYNLNIGRKPCTKLDFNFPSYYFLFYNDLAQDYEFEVIDYQPIFAKCAQNLVDFDIEENEYFSLVNIGDRGSKGEYYATVRTKQDIQAPFNKFFNITAVDTKDPENFATAVLEVLIFKPEKTVFMDSYYFGAIYRDLTIVIDNGPIVLITALDIKDIEMEIMPDYGDFFELELSSEEIQLVVSPQAKYEELNDTSLMIVLKAYDPFFEYTAETVVVLNVSSEILTKVSSAIEDVSTMLAPQEEKNGEIDENGDNQDVPDKGEDHEANNEDGDNGDEGKQIDDDGDEYQNLDGDDDEDQKLDNNDKDQKVDGDDDEDQKVDDDDGDEYQKVDGDDNEDQKVHVNDEDQKANGDDYVDQKPDDDDEDQKGGDGDEGQKDNGDADDDYNDDDGVVIEDGIIIVEVPSTAFDYWVAHTITVTIIIVAIASFIIVSSIIYLRSRTPHRRYYMYDENI